MLPVPTPRVRADGHQYRFRPRPVPRTCVAVGDSVQDARSRTQQEKHRMTTMGEPVAVQAEALLASAFARLQEPTKKLAAIRTTGGRQLALALERKDAIFVWAELHDGSVSGVTSTLGPASAQSWLRAKAIASPARPASASDRGWAMLAEAKISAVSPWAIRSRSRPEGPNVPATAMPVSFRNAAPPDDATSPGGDFQAFPHLAGCAASCQSFAAVRAREWGVDKDELRLLQAFLRRSFGNEDIRVEDVRHQTPSPKRLPSSRSVATLENPRSRNASVKDDRPSNVLTIIADANRLLTRAPVLR